ncbi:MAG: phosphoribosylanthranilate isomerase [Acidimicrobiia bacterium]
MTVLRERGDGRVWVKLCGFRDPEMATVAVGEGADAIGVVLHADSPRNATVGAAAEVVAAAAPVPVVAVVVDRSRADLERIVGDTGVAGVQLCGREPAADAMWLHATFPGVCVIRTRHVAPTATGWGRLESDGADAVLVDADVEGIAGGSGTGLRWEAPAIAAVPVILAGGLDASTVAGAVAAVRPFGVDVSSALEVERGKKDPARIRAFMDAVRATVTV